MISDTWGYSQIEAGLVLLDKFINRRKHFYLITRAAFLLQTQKIHTFYEEHGEIRLANLNKCKPIDMERNKLCYFFKYTLGEKTLEKVLRKFIITCPKARESGGLFTRKFD